MEPGPGPSHVPSAKGDVVSIAVSRSSDKSRIDSAAALDVPGEPIASPGRAKIRRLVADQRYFGLEARVFHAGAERLLEHVAVHGSEQPRIDVHTLGDGFRLDPSASWALLRALLADGLLNADGAGRYRLTERFREYAFAPMVAPLSRARAKVLIERACGLAARINADESRNPFRIKMVAVSGSYMSRSKQVPELFLWLVLRRRSAKRSRRWRSMLSKDEALRQILAALRALSSFIVVRIVADKHAVQRPFSVVFQSSDSGDSYVSAFQRFRDWGDSISRRLMSK